MTVPDNLSLPLLILVGLALIALFLLFGRGGRGGGAQETAQVIAAVQAERDALRAQHAVEVATLEGKLSETTARLQREADASLKLREVERKLAAARAEADERTVELADLAQRFASVARDRDEKGARAGEVQALVAERDRARTDAASAADTVSQLRRELQESIAKLSRATADGANRDDRVAAAIAERDRAAADAQRLEGTVADLKREVQALVSKLSQSATANTRLEESVADLERLRQREEVLRATVAEREKTILALREEIRSRDGGAEKAEIQRLASALAAAEEREVSANEALSRLAYEKEGLLQRVNAADRVTSQSRAEVEKHEALLELRLQKIYALEARLRDQHAQLSDAQRRAAAAEEMVATLRSGGELPPAPDVDAEMQAKVERLQIRLDEMRNQNGTLLDELEALREKVMAEPEARDSTVAALHGELDALRRELAAAEKENKRLRDQGGVAPAEVEALKAKLREVAARFVQGSEAPPPPAAENGAEPTLAERIRAFKAARVTAGR